MNFLISLGICATPKLSKYVAFSVFTYEAIQLVLIGLNSSRLITDAPSFTFGKLFLE